MFAIRTASKLIGLDSICADDIDYIDIVKSLRGQDLFFGVAGPHSLIHHALNTGYCMKLWVPSMTPDAWLSALRLALLYYSPAYLIGYTTDAVKLTLGSNYLDLEARIWSAIVKKMNLNVEYMGIAREANDLTIRCEYEYYFGEPPPGREPLKINPLGPVAPDVVLNFTEEEIIKRFINFTMPDNI